MRLLKSILTVLAILGFWFSIIIAIVYFVFMLPLLIAIPLIVGIGSSLAYLLLYVFEKVA